MNSCLNKPLLHRYRECTGNACQRVAENDSPPQLSLLPPSIDYDKQSHQLHEIVLPCQPHNRVTRKPIWFCSKDPISEEVQSQRDLLIALIAYNKRRSRRFQFVLHYYSISSIPQF